MDNTNFLKLLEKFAEEQKEDWHISYNIHTGDLVGIHPKDPRKYQNRTHIMHSEVRKMHESEMEFLDRLVNGGLPFHCVDLQKDHIKLKPKKIVDWGELTRIEFNNDLDSMILDISISVLIEQKKILIKLRNSDLKESLKRFLNHQHDVWITSYNDATVIYNTINLDLNTLIETGEYSMYFDNSHLPMDISMYYLKLVDKIAFEVK